MWTSIPLAGVTSPAARISACWAPASMWPSMTCSREAAATSEQTSTSRRVSTPWTRRWKEETGSWEDFAGAGRTSRQVCAATTRLLWWASGWSQGRRFFLVFLCDRHFFWLPIHQFSWGDLLLLCQWRISLCSRRTRKLLKANELCDENRKMIFTRKWMIVH